MFRNLSDMRQSLERHLELDGDHVTGIRNGVLPPGAIDAFARNAVFHANPTVRTLLRKVLREAAALKGVTSARLPAPTAGSPLRIAFRLGGHCYDLARLVLRSAKGEDPDRLVFEQGWAGQSPWEFSALMAAAALREGWRAPLYLRCCLPPLAGDLLDGGRDADTLQDRMQTAMDAQFHNLTIRTTPSGVLHERSMQELTQLLSVATDSRLSVLLRFWDEHRPLEASPGPALAGALHDMCAGHPPMLIGLNPDILQQKSAGREAWLKACGAAGVSVSGGSTDLAPDPRVAAEWRPDFRWAERIVLHPEFPAEQRRRLLDWLNRGPFEGDDPLRRNLLRSYEYQALGHFEFELWNLDGMPTFRSSFQEEMAELFARCR